MSDIRDSHLSLETVDALLIEPDATDLAEARAHLRGCGACRAALTAAEAAIGGLRADARDAAEQAMRRLVMRPPAPPDAAVRGDWWRGVRPAPVVGLFAGAAAAVAGILLLLPPHTAGSAAGASRPAVAAVAPLAAGKAGSEAAVTMPPQRPVTRTPEADNSADEALLTSVDTELSRSVAGPLQPLSDPMPSQSSTAGQANN